MLRFKTTVIALVIILIIVLAVDYLLPVNKWIYAGIILAGLLIMAWGSKYMQFDFYLKSICSGSRDKKEVALTFDDGPDAQVTPMILDVLKEHNLKATFFIIGNKAEMNPELLKRIDKEGHNIGGHTYSHHFFFDLFTSSRMIREMKKTEDIVYNIIGKRMCLFRPPYGVTNPTLARSITSLQYLSIGWSLKSRDTVIKDEFLLLGRLSKNIKPGDIILFHDNKPWTVNVLKNFIRNLNDQNLKIIRLDKFLNIQPYVY